MSKEAPETRSIVQEIEIDAPIEAVWKAITEAKEITRWLSEEARVTPGVGGNYWVSWGEGQAGDSSIEVWEPGRRLRLRNLPAKKAEDPCTQYDEQAAQSTTMIQEFTIESRGGKTVLRLVDSGIPDSKEWEGFYDGKTRGWDMFFRGLRHYLEKHPGEPRKNIVDFRSIKDDMNTAWKKLTGTAGLAASGSFVDLAEGMRYSVTTSLGDALTGEVLINLPPKTLSLTVENLNDALLSATFEQMGGINYFYLTLAMFGMEPEAHQQLQKRWTSWLHELLPSN